MVTIGGGLSGAYNITKEGVGGFTFTSAPSHLNTIINGGEIRFSPTTNGTFSFGSGSITLSNGTFRFAGPNVNTTNILTNSPVGRGRLRARCGPPGRGQHAAAVRRGGRPERNLLVNGGSNDGQTVGNFGAIQTQLNGTITLNGGNRALTFQNGANRPMAITGNITQDGSARRLSIAFASTYSQTLSSAATIRG
jgi:hypothetical protein